MKQFFKFVLASMVAQIILGIISLFFVIGVIANLVATTSEEIQIKENSILEITLNYEMPNRGMSSAFPAFSGNSTLGLNAAIDAIKKAQDDPNIKGIYLNLTMASPVSTATLQELRQAINNFKKSEKFVWAYSDNYSQGAYYIASAADKVYLHNEGMVDFRGLSSQHFFLKGALEKLGVEMQIVRHGKFKSAIEPFVNEQMSPENREQTQKYLSTLWHSLITDIAESRNLSTEELNRIADEMLAFEPENAKNLNLIDDILTHNDMLQLLVDATNQTDFEKLEIVDLKKYAKVPARPVKSKNRIAVIYAQGEINMGNGGPYAIGSENISSAIRKAANDDKIKAIVLRVNSPGGDALASDIILQEVIAAKAKKPVVASFSDYAASGGYYIACGANFIFAQPTTLTGSIGVFGTIPNAKKLLNEKIGVTFDEVATNTNAGFLTVTRPLNTFEEAKLHAQIERVYNTFITHVANGRNLTKEYVDSIGQGRVWSGVNALQIGLIDEFGGLQEALAKAAELADIADYRVVDFPKEKDQMEQLLEMFGNTKTNLLKSEMGELYPLFEHYKTTLSLKPAVMARIPYIEEIR